MVAAADILSYASSAPFGGLRLSAAEFFQLPDDGGHYELIDGVVLMSPSPTPRHQHVTGTIYRLLASFLDSNSVGMAFVETDIHLGQNREGADIVYRPEITYLRSDRLSDITDRINGAPDLVVEVVSRGSRRFDSETKKGDYERFGVREYWLIDPDANRMTFFRLDGDRYVEVSVSNEQFQSEAVPGFSLDLALIRKTFKPF